MKTALGLPLGVFLVGLYVTLVSPQSFQGGLRGAVRDADPTRGARAAIRRIHGAGEGLLQRAIGIEGLTPPLRALRA